MSEWTQPLDPMTDSDAPAQIRHELGRRHAIYLREAQRIASERQVPDENGLADGIRAETARYLASHPWLGEKKLRPAVDEAQRHALASLGGIMAVARAAAAPAPVRRLALEPAATYVGTMPLRKRRTVEGVELEWSRDAGVGEWVVRVSVRPDPRGDYAEVEVVTLPGTATSYAVALDDAPRRIQVTGVGRTGRVAQRATVTALTRRNSGAQWRRQASGG